MAIALVMPDRATAALKKALRRHLPDTRVDVWPDLNPDVDYPLAIAWQPQPDAIASVPGIQAVHSLGAGVDALLQDPTLPEHLPIARIVDPDLSGQMAEYALMHVLAFKRRLLQFDQQQRQSEWRPALPRELSTVGVLGLGEIGQTIAARFLANGYQVHGWARRPHDLSGVHSHTGESGLRELLAASQAVVCVLPLTSDTEGLLDAHRLAYASPDSLLINIARGALVEQSGLLSALRDGPLSHAVLDVFVEEPLPQDHPYWSHPAITITPHIAGLTNPRTATAQIVDNYRRLCAGETMNQLVDRARGY